MQIGRTGEDTDPRLGKFELHSIPIATHCYMKPHYKGFLRDLYKLFFTGPPY